MSRLTNVVTAVTVVLALRGAAGVEAQGTVGGRDTLPLLAGMPREQQIRLAMSAAPAQVSEQATVYVLTPRGYIKVREGTNGFSCLVERQFLETLEPQCYDAEGSTSTLQARLYREELRASGVPEDKIESRIDEAYKAGRFLAPRKPGLVYMLSTHARVFDPVTKTIIPAPPHLMFYAPHATQKDVGGFSGYAQLPPFVLNEGRPDAYMIIIVRP